MRQPEEMQNPVVMTGFLCEARDSATILAFWPELVRTSWPEMELLQFYCKVKTCSRAVVFGQLIGLVGSSWPSVNTPVRRIEEPAVATLGQVLTCSVYGFSRHECHRLQEVTINHIIMR